ncbi:hypothetical protein PFFVO_06162, partial [Plasmodium falciparum Vietnam Oak-Knoll (FVO)]
KEKKPQEGVLPQPLPTLDLGDDNNPQNQLKSGTIPNDFLRLMFYTLGDYRDICVGVKDDDVIKALEASSDKNIKEISDKIKNVIENSGSKPSDEKRKKWWDENAKYIWNGMICALTYKESGTAADGKKIEKDSDVYNKFFGTPNGNPVPPTGTTGTSNGTTGTYEKDYKYNTVTLKEDENSDPKNTKASPSSGDNTPPKTTLKDFVLRPPYFRYLEEWGQNFCKERKKRLEKIEEECTDGGGKYTGRYCGGDGFDCIKIGPNKDGIIKGFDCPGCGRECRKYKQWIETKRKEFDKQKKAYIKQKENCKQESGGGGTNKFCEKLEKDAAAFLHKLGPCSKNNSGEGNGKDILDFDKDSKTFQPAKDCDPCPIFGIESRNSGWSNVQKKKCKDNGKDFISAEDIEKMEKPTEELVMHVSDNDTTKFDGDLKDCTGADIFKGIRKDVWKCGKFCDVDVCALKKDNGSIDDKQIILIRALLKQWLEIFFDDYNKINAKISHCTNNAEGITCISGCDKKCKCVGQWIEKKRGEWGKIKNHYKKQNENGDNNMTSLVTNVLEELIPQIDVTIDKKNYTSLEELVKKFKCKCADSSKSDKEGNKKDIVDCLLSELQQKIQTCDKTPLTSCDSPPSLSDVSPQPNEEEETEEENPENTVTHPQICKDEIKDETKQEEGEDECKAVTPPKEKEDEEEPEPPPPTEPERTEKLPSAPKSPEEKAPAPEPTPPPPPLAPSDESILHTTLPLGIALALGSIAFLFLK